MVKSPTLKEPTGTTAGGNQKWGGPDALHAAQLLKGIRSGEAIQQLAIDGLISSLDQKQNSPLFRLTGDEFAQLSADSIFLLNNGLTDKQGGTSLINNGAFTFIRQLAEDDPFGVLSYYAAVLNGTSQYASILTEAKVEVGTDSFIAKINFKINNKQSQTLMSYGDLATSEQNWFVQIQSTNDMRFVIDDGTTPKQVTDKIIDRTTDKKWHTAIIFVDRINNKLYGLIDGRLIGITDISAVTGTLNNAGTSLRIGAVFLSGVSNYFNGSLMNFQLYSDADPLKLWNIIGLLNAGLRESALNSNPPYPTLVSYISSRFNNSWLLGHSDGNYAYCLIDIEEGNYDIIINYEENLDRGILDLLIDGKVVINQLNADATNAQNIIYIEKNVFISGRHHLLKFLINGGTGTDHFWRIAYITFIKREGHEKGGCTEFLLLGDEINQRQVGGWSGVVNSGVEYNNRFLNADKNDKDFTEGEIFIKGGLWEVTTQFAEAADGGQADLDFGNVEIIDKLDLDNASPNGRLYVKKIVRLNQGKTNIRLAVNGTSDTEFGVRVQHIKGVRLSD